MDLNIHYQSLVDSLKLLAASYREQVETLPGYVNVVDEVVITFRDAFMLMPQLIENGFLSNQAIGRIIHCHNLAEMFYRCEEYSGPEAFRDLELWELVREQAAEALAAVNSSEGRKIEG